MFTYKQIQPMIKNFNLLLLSLMLTGCYRGNGGGVMNEYVYYPEAGSTILFIRPAKDARVKNSSTEFSTLDGKVPFSLTTSASVTDDNPANYSNVNNPSVWITIGFTGKRMDIDYKKIELDCSRAALILNGRRFAHKVGADAEKEMQRAKESRKAWSLECIKEIALYDKSGVYEAKLLFKPGERLGESFSIELPIVKDDPQMSKPLVVKFIRELREIRHS